MAENREHQLVEGDAVMRVSGGGHFKQKSIKSKFVSISLRDKLIFLFVGTLFVELLLFGCVMSFYLYINAKKNVSDNIDTTVTAVSEVMDQSFLVMENLVLELAASNGVQNWLDDSHYYDRENSEFYLRKTEFSRELNRILIYSNAKKLDVVEYAAVFNDGYLLDYVDVQSVGGNKVQREVYKAYEAAEQETEKYIYSELVMGSENVIFHIRRMRSDFERDVPLIIMVATNERDIASQYENLVQNEGEVVYLIDEENKVLSSNKEDEIGSYIDEKITECDTGETQPNTDTLKLLSRVFDVSINTLLGSPRQLVCQCCGMPLNEDGLISREPDGSYNEDYCKWCYANGKFAYQSKESLLDYLVANMPNPDNADEETRRNQFDLYLSQLKHWK